MRQRDGYAWIVEEYIAERRPQTTEERARFTRMRSLAEVVRIGAMCEDERGKRLSHQWRIPRASLESARDALLSVLPALRKAPTFEALHDVIHAVIRPIFRIGDLVIYDITMRIGAKLGLEPRIVYLHAGTRVGARRLGFPASRLTLEMGELPQAFRRLRPYEAEDVLCIYNDHFGTDAQTSRKRNVTRYQPSCVGVGKPRTGSASIAPSACRNMTPNVRPSANAKRSIC